jgi:RNA polymerase sigma-70 factor (ECF subfamily)
MPMSLANASVAADAPMCGIARNVPRDGLGSSRSNQREARVRRMVDRHIHFVARVLRNAGTPEAEIDDDVQHTFIAAYRRLDDVRPGAETSFLAQVALRVAAHARRTVKRRREVSEDQAPESVDSLATPEQLADQKRARQMLDLILDRMDPAVRTVFILFEFEEMSLTEIASVLGAPRGTVASRLRRARKDFRNRVWLLKQQRRSRWNHE